jgi:hypothetical protein
MANDLQLVLDFIVRDLGSDKFAEISDRARKTGIDIEEAFQKSIRAGERHEAQVGKTAHGLDQLGRTATEALGPVGGALDKVFEGFGQIAGGLDEVIAKAGLSTTSLVGIGIGALAIGGVAEALSKAAEQAERLEKAVVAASIGTRNFEDSKRRIEKFAPQVSNDTGIPQEQLAGAAGAALGAFGNNDSALNFARSAEFVAVAQFGKIDELVKRSIPLFKAYDLALSDSEQVFAELAKTSQASNIPLEQLIATMSEGAPIAKRLGISFEDALAQIGAAGASGAAPDAARQGLSRLLEVISDADNTAHKRLSALGASFNGSLGDVVESINATIKANGGGKLFAELFPAGRGQDAITAALSITRRGLDDLKASYITATNDIRDLATQVGNEPGEQLSRASEQLKNSFVSLGKDFESGKARFFGSKLELPVEIQVPENIGALVARIREEVQAGNVEAARTDQAKLHELGNDAGKLYGEAYAEAVKLRQEQLARELRAIKPGKVDPSTFKVDSIPGLDEKAFVSRIQSGITTIDDLIKHYSVELPIELAPPKNLPATLDLLQSDIERAIRSIDLTPLDFRPKVLPPDVAQAQKALDEIEAKLTNADGSKKSSESLLDNEKQRARDSVQTILQYYQSVVQIQRVSLGIDGQTGGALDRQHAQHEAVLQSVRDTLTELRLQPDQIDKVRAKLPGLAADFARVEQSTTTAAGLSFQAGSLAAREKELTTLRDMAKLSGDLASADEYDRKIVETKAREQRTAVLQQQQADLLQAGNDDDVIRRINARTEAQLREANAAEKAANATFDRSVTKRDTTATAQELTLSRELLDGLDAELAKINDTTAARKAAVDVSELDVGLRGREKGLLDQIGQKQLLLAQANAKFFQADAITNIIGNIPNSYAAQVTAIDLSRAAEKARFEQSLRNAGTEIALRHQLLDAFDAETDARRRAATVAFAGRGAADIAHENLLTEAYNSAADAAAFLGFTQQQTWQAEIDSVTRATDGARAWSEGWRSGITDALREMNEFNSALQAGQSVITGFRDSLVEAFDGIGQKGHNFLKDFGTSELKNLQHTFSTLASTQITSALGGALGLNVPNKADALSPASATLNTAGLHLITSAAALQSAAFALGGKSAGIDSGLLASIFGSGGAGRPGAVGPDTAGTSLLGFSEGGIFNGVPQWARGASPKANRVGGVYGSRTLIEVAEVPGSQEAVVPLAGGKIPVDLRGSGAGARQRVYDSTPQRVVNVDSSTTMGDVHLHVTVNGGSGPIDGEKLARQMAPHIRSVIKGALVSRSDNELVEAVRGAGR